MNLGQTMDPLAKLADLEKTIDSLAPLVDDCLNASDDDLIASRNIHLAFTLNTLYLLHLRLTGQSLKGHPIREEITRIKEYFRKLENDKGNLFNLIIANMKIDKDAAKRFIKGALK